MATTNDFMGGCSFKISDILENPKSGWFKLSDMGEAELEEAEEVEEWKVMSSEDDENTLTHVFRKIREEWLSKS